MNKWPFSLVSLAIEHSGQEARGRQRKLDTNHCVRERVYLYPSKLKREYRNAIATQNAATHTKTRAKNINSPAKMKANKF